MVQLNHIIKYFETIQTAKQTVAFNIISHSYLVWYSIAAGCKLRFRITKCPHPTKKKTKTKINQFSSIVLYYYVCEHHNIYLLQQNGNRNGN